MLSFTRAVGAGAPPDAMRIRTAVFVDEQGFTDEFDDTDAISTHVVSYINGKAIATGRVFFDHGDTWHIGRVAVLREYRGRGVGVATMAELELIAVEQGARRIILGAQLHAILFYERLGYAPFGDAFHEEECPHLHMEKFFCNFSGQ